MYNIDARGCACPEPVLMVKKACVQNIKEIEVKVDNPAAFENVKRFAANNNYNVAFTHEGTEYILTLTK